MNNIISANEYLREFYLLYVNDYLSVERIAEHHEIPVSTAQIMINAGRELQDEYADHMKLATNPINIIEE